MAGFLSVLAIVLALAGVGLGVMIAVAERSSSNAVATAMQELPGWVYFLSPVGGAEVDPPDPIKIGLTHRDPMTGRMPEIQTMSPKPLEVIQLIYTSTPTLLEMRIHRELGRYRRHGEWFDRDAVLAWLDNYIATTKGVMA